ncbi:MAG: VanZ family protein, partial [Proteobacteria bacterium]|nr:VanZ family protein [Pseudomonadota bacterium]
ILAGRNIPASRLILMLIAYAALTEILQHFVPGRSFSVLDWVADSLGVLVAVLTGLYVMEHFQLLTLKPD